MIKEGSASVVDDGEVVGQCERDTAFGETSLLPGDVRTTTMVAGNNMVCYSLSRSKFVELLGPYEDVWRFEALKKVGICLAGTSQQTTLFWSMCAY